MWLLQWTIVGFVSVQLPFLAPLGPSDLSPDTGMVSVQQGPSS